MNQLLDRNWNGNGMEWNGIDFGWFDGFYILITVRVYFVGGGFFLLVFG